MGVMRLEELAENQKLHIEVIAKTGRLEYDVVSKFSAHGAVFIEPIRYNNQIINFVRSDIIIKVLYTRNNRKPIEWSNCYIKSVEYKGKQYHMIGSNNVGIESPRVFPYFYRGKRTGTSWGTYGHYESDGKRY